MRPFFRLHSFGSKLGIKIVEELLPGIVACVVIWQMGGWTLRNGWLIKIQLHGKAVFFNLGSAEP
jgi:hypothetical protein